MQANKKQCFSLLPSLMSASAVYWLTIYPLVRTELSRWEHYARTIPDPVLRAQARHKLTAERLNPEAAAFFAVLSPRNARANLVRLIVGYQILYDYLDAINELPGYTDLQTGLLLHGALHDAVRPDQSVQEHRQRPLLHDGGYVCALTETCRRQLFALPSWALIEPQLASAVQRVCEAQSHNHTVASGGISTLRHWCLEHDSNDRYLWWETAAGGISCLGVHALFTLCADLESTADEADLVDAAYFPSVCALSALLDSLSDHDSDAGTPNHSFTAHYRDSAQASERIGAIATEATELVAGLRRRRRHAIIVAGIVAFYLSSTTVETSFTAPVSSRLLSLIGLLGPPMSGMMRIRRYLRPGVPD
jgi:tetraprenyl-beta-curcumene synthase